MSRQFPVNVVRGRMKLSLQTCRRRWRPSEPFKTAPGVSEAAGALEGQAHPPLGRGWAWPHRATASANGNQTEQQSETKKIRQRQSNLCCWSFLWGKSFFVFGDICFVLGWILCFFVRRFYLTSLFRPLQWVSHIVVLRVLICVFCC